MKYHGSMKHYNHHKPKLDPQIDILTKTPYTHKIYHFLTDHVNTTFFKESFQPNPPLEHEYTLSISQGCIHHCAFCGLYIKKRPFISKPLSQCIEEFKQALIQEKKQIILSADDAGPYGFDIGTSLPELLNEITKIEGNYTLKITATHPAWIIKYIDELTPSFQRKKIESLLIAIQSGNHRILRLMHRSYNKNALISALKKLKKTDSNLIINAQCILGFPSETRREFMDTIHFIEKVRFNNGFINSYIPIEKTEAIKITPQISINEKRKRLIQAIEHLQKYGYSVTFDRAYRWLSFQE
jgi:tRNA A37 methylthiotransferase MiaB